MTHRAISRKGRTRFTLAGAMLLATVGLTAACSEGPAHTVERSVVDGVEVIQNPAGPMYPGEGRLTKVLEIGVVGGPGDDPDYMFGTITGASLGPDVLVVADRAHHHIRVFDFDGRHLRTFGGPGEGPGEFGWIDHVDADADGIAVLERSGRVSLFDLEGRYQGQVQTRQLVPQARTVDAVTRLDAERLLFDASVNHPNTDHPLAALSRFIILDRDGDWEIFGEDRDYPSREEMIQMLVERSRPDIIAEYYGYRFDRGYHSPDVDRGLLYSTRRAFPSEVLVYELGGSIERVISRDVIAPGGLSFRVVPPDELAGAQDGRSGLVISPIGELPQGAGRIYRFHEEALGVHHDAEHIYVFLHSLADDDGFEAYMDVFEIDTGHFKWRVPFEINSASSSSPLGPRLIGRDDDGDFYFRATDEELGFGKIVKYRLEFP